MMHRFWAGLVLAISALGCAAETSQVSPTGFISSFREELRVSPAQAWKAIVQLPVWWNDAHTWSGKASNMSLDLQAGGCWCERWGEGRSVMHGQVVQVQPGLLVRMNASLGPLQELGAQGVLTIVTSAQEGKTFLRLTYRVAGGPETNLDKLAPAVDRVLSEQFKRLKALAEAD
ncbi:MAG: SRPBCC family protein [Rubrivivax sp.]|nr:SRPBCC family protein [Rubrivivax sp.]